MENVVNLIQAFEGKRVWLSGHTGFKGSWLSEWLIQLGAVVHGYALAPDTKPSLFDQLGLAGRLEHEVADIRDGDAVKKSLRAFNPDFVIHMAAQPLVRRSYAIPVETYETNVMGTINVLEALRGVYHPCVAVVVTTDKCYENHESGRAYEEGDPLGGHDPYSSSKAMAEIATAAYRNSYFQNGPVHVASARAGNVIGGGDWAEDRIVPDAMRSLDQGEKIAVRNPSAVRPWQHVLEPLSGYLTLAALIAAEQTTHNHQPTTAELCSAYNFGPGPESNRTVSDLVQEILKHRQGEWTDASDPAALHEATLLNLSIEKADQLLGWRPHWGFEETISKTVAWYARVHTGTASALEITRSQIAEYVGDLP
jgi:CDP-glucose 4,6-dehydratase